MKWCSKKIQLAVLPRAGGFSLPEVMATLMILALISSSVLVVINRCMASAANSTLRMEAFRVARENMEKLLASGSVSEMVEYGSSDRYPQIQWQTVVESFYEPITKRMWVQAICSAEYKDVEDQVQTIEMTHWLTSLTKSQLIQIAAEKRKEKWLLAELGEGEEAEQDKEDGEDKEPKIPDEDLPFCERDLMTMTFEELMRYINECFDW